MSLSRVARIIEEYEGDLLSEWIGMQLRSLTRRRDLISEPQLRTNSHDFLLALRSVKMEGDSADLTKPEWSKLRDLLSDLSRQRATQGFTPSETANFVFSFKQPLFERLRQQFANDPAAFSQEVWTANELLDALGLYTIEVFQKVREEVISRQQQELMELSTPVVRLWSGILALPLIGTLDSNRTQVVMQSLLQSLVDEKADLAIIDITGVPTVDTLVAQHLLKTIAAARLMGAECIISGIRPQIAQTIIHLGVDLGDVLTKASLADAFRLALQRKNLAVTKV